MKTDSAETQLISAALAVDRAIRTLADAIAHGDPDRIAAAMSRLGLAHSDIATAATRYYASTEDPDDLALSLADHLWDATHEARELAARRPIYAPIAAALADALRQLETIQNPQP